MGLQLQLAERNETNDMHKHNNGDVENKQRRKEAMQRTCHGWRLNVANNCESERVV